MAPVDMHQAEATPVVGSVGGPTGATLAAATPPPPPVDEMEVMSIGAAATGGSVGTSGAEPENEPSDADKTEQLLNAQLPATFLRTICDQLEFYFCDENLLGDLFLLKNMNMEGYVKLELLASFGRVKKLTTDMDQIRKALELSTKLIMNEDQTMVCRKDPLPPNQTYHGKLARTAIAYNLPEDCSVASLRETFQGCGEISYLRLLRKNTTTGRNAVLKPPIVAGETYAIIEFVDEEMAKHAVLTLSDQYNPQSGLQVVLFDGTNCERLKQRMFPDVGGSGGGDRRRAKSASAITRPVHVEQVGEGLDDLREGKVSTGTVYSIRGAGGLITPTRHDSACISFRLIPDEDGNIDIRQGDYVSFTVGKNKKSGRKYASKVKLEFRPPQNIASDLSVMANNRDRDRDSSNRWEGRGRASTVGTPLAQPTIFRSRSSSSGSRPRLNLSSPRTSTSPPSSTNSMAAGLLGNNSPHYRQAVGPDGSRGFGARRGANGAEVVTSRKLSQPAERRRSSSSAAAMQY